MNEVRESFDIGAKILMTGLLGLLWYDVRKSRLLKEVIKEEVKREYLSKEVHTLLCNVQASNTENKILRAIHETKDEIIKEVKKLNGGG